MSIYLLENSIQHYSWGSKTFIPTLIGQESSEPCAELWMGAHPKAPSIAIDSKSGEKTKLDELIASKPSIILGTEVSEKFDKKLPYLLKILSAEQALSIQAHPTKRKAEIGYHKEELANITLDAPDRNYKDPNHKPETIIALTDFHTMCGFRHIDQIIELMQQVFPDDWEDYIGILKYKQSKAELSTYFYNALANTEVSKKRLLSTRIPRLERILFDSPKFSEIHIAVDWILKLLKTFPNDIGAFAPLSLNIISLKPGEGLNLKPASLHAYLEGSGIEIMANSDNVLRGGLTKKHIDVVELISALNFETGKPEVFKVGSDEKNKFEYFPQNYPDYSISKLELDGKMKYTKKNESPEILLCIEGDAIISTSGAKDIQIEKGQSVFVAANTSSYTLTGKATVYKAGVLI